MRTIHGEWFEDKKPCCWFFFKSCELFMHTSLNSFNKWTKISSLEITIFILKFTEPLQRYLLGQFRLSAQFHSLGFLGLCLKQDYVQESFRDFIFFKIKTNLEFLFIRHRNRLKTKSSFLSTFFCVLDQRDFLRVPMYVKKV